MGIHPHLWKNLYIDIGTVEFFSIHTTKNICGEGRVDLELTLVGQIHKFKEG